MLQLDAIAQHERKRLGQLALEQDVILVKLMAGQHYHLLDHLVYIQFAPFGRRFRYKCADPGYNGARTSSGGDDFFESPTQNFRSKITIGKQSEAGAAVIGYSG